MGSGRLIVFCLEKIKKLELGNRDMAEVHTKTKQAMMALQGMADVKIY